MTVFMVEQLKLINESADLWWACITDRAGSQIHTRHRHKLSHWPVKSWSSSQNSIRNLKTGTLGLWNRELGVGSWQLDGPGLETHHRKLFTIRKLFVDSYRRVHLNEHATPEQPGRVFFCIWFFLLSFGSIHRAQMSCDGRGPWPLITASCAGNRLTWCWWGWQWGRGIGIECYRSPIPQ